MDSEAASAQPALPTGATDGTTTARPAPLLSLDDEDESVRIAVRALGDMRSGALRKSPSTISFQPTPALSSTSASTTPSLPSPTLSFSPGGGVDPLGDVLDDEAPLPRASNHPIVNTALRAYAQGKASSSVVRYGADLMESSLQTLSRPVIERLPVNVDALDEFAGRQLDKVYRRRPSISNPPTKEGVASPISSPRASTETITEYEEAEDAQPPTRATTQPSAAGSTSLMPRASRWQAVLTHTTGLSAALSDESMRRLRFCLQRLQFATAHLDAQIVVLRDFIAGLQVPAPPPGDPREDGGDVEGAGHAEDALVGRRALSPARLHTLTAVRKDVVDTVRQVVDVVSKYAGSALPGPARERVRTFILCLPQRWASAAAAEPKAGNVPAMGRRRGGASSMGGIGPVRASPVSSRASSPLPSPRAPYHIPHHTSSSSSPTSPSPSSSLTTTGGSGGPAHSKQSAQAAAQRLLALATESLDMMRGVTGVVRESLDRADEWVERLGLRGVAGTEEGARAPAVEGGMDVDR